MDLDAYAAAHAAEWDRLGRLARQRRLSGREIDELIDRYRSGASQLAAMSSAVGESSPGAALSVSLSRARLRFTRASTNPLQRLAHFFTLDMPAAMYRVRWLTLAVLAVSAVVALVEGLWLSADPARIAALGSDAQLRAYATRDFTGYYSASGEGLFAAQVWTHNALLAAQTIALGVTGAGAAYFLLANAFELGQAGAVMGHFGRLDTFFLYISPHGQLELYTVFLAGAAGLLLFWAWVAPGRDRSRGQALAEDGRAFFCLVIACALMLATSGVIEGAVTRQPWPWPVKIGLGTLALGAWLTYQWVLGRRAVRLGATGDLDPFEAGASSVTAG